MPSAPPNFPLYCRRIGEISVTSIVDDVNPIPFSDLENLAQDAAEKTLADNFQPSPIIVPVLCFLLRWKERVALVDTGFGEPRGHLNTLLVKAGIDRKDIDTVILTHMHPDHSCGLRLASGEAAFPNAEIVLARAEMDHWDDDDAMDRATQRQRERYFRSARYQIEPYRDRLRWADGEVWPGVTAVPMPGHTPGHTGYMVESLGERALIWGDLCHVPGLQLPYPVTKTKYDSLPDLTVQTRERMLGWIADERIRIAGMHMHFPGYAYIVRRGNAFDYVQEPWIFEVTAPPESA